MESEAPGCETYDQLILNTDYSNEVAYDYLWPELPSKPPSAIYDYCSFIFKSRAQVPSECEEYESIYDYCDAANSSSPLPDENNGEELLYDYCDLVNNSHSHLKDESNGHETLSPETQTEWSEGNTSLQDAVHQGRNQLLDYLSCNSQTPQSNTVETFPAVNVFSEKPLVDIGNNSNSSTFGISSSYFGSPAESTDENLTLFGDSLNDLSEDENKLNYRKYPSKSVSISIQWKHSDESAITSASLPVKSSLFSNISDLTLTACNSHSIPSISDAVSKNAVRFLSVSVSALNDNITIPSHVGRRSQSQTYFGYTDLVHESLLVDLVDDSNSLPPDLPPRISCPATPPPRPPAFKPRTAAPSFEKVNICIDELDKEKIETENNKWIFDPNLSSQDVKLSRSQSIISKIGNFARESLPFQASRHRSQSCVIAKGDLVDESLLVDFVKDLCNPPPKLPPRLLRPPSPPPRPVSHSFKNSNIRIDELGKEKSEKNYSNFGSDEDVSVVLRKPNSKRISCSTTVSYRFSCMPELIAWDQD